MNKDDSFEALSDLKIPQAFQIDDDGNEISVVNQQVHNGGTTENTKTIYIADEDLLQIIHL